MSGRSSYREEFVKQAVRFARLGLTDEEMAAAFGVARQSLTNWREDHPEFSDAITNGKVFADANVATRLYKRACGYSAPAVKVFNQGGKALVVDYIEHYPPDTTACIFWLKNRQPKLWRDKLEVEHGVTDELAQMIENLRSSREMKVIEAIEHQPQERKE